MTIEIDDIPDNIYAGALNGIVNLCHQKSLANGWWKDTDTFDPYIVPAKIMLIVSELAEAMEGDRTDAMDKHLPHRKAIEVECADAIHRICDLCGWLGLDLGGALVEKIAYNDVRPDHKLDVRSTSHGKRY